jgi:hypothetical protein
VTDEDWMAYWVGVLAPRHDSDDETYLSQFYVYHKNGTPKRVFFGNPPRVF